MTFSPLLLQRLENAYRVVVLTGAGMSAASGVPTFRGKDGLWNKYNPQDLASLGAFLRHPELVWEWYSWRRGLIRKVKPNPGHHALVDLESLYGEFYVITQNVDNLHRKAGTQKIIELHGNIMHNKCIDCTYTVRDEELETLELTKGNKVPRCPECGSLIRPDVVWFGELLPAHAIEAAQRLSAAAEVFFSVGTSSTVEPAASLPHLARGNGAYLVEVNPEETLLSPVVDERIAVGAHEALPRLLLEVKQIKKLP